MTNKNKRANEELLTARKPAEKRLAFIDFRMAFVGSLRRPLLQKEFGISPQQATKDIKAYIKLAPNNISYSLALKSYQPTETFKPKFRTTSTKTYLRRLELVANGSRRYRRWVGVDVSATLSRAPIRIPEGDVLKAVVNALRNKLKIEVDYMSINSGLIERRSIVPKALASDGYRWHTRAWDVNKQQYSDFVLSRMSEPEIHGFEAHPIPYDEAWELNCEVIFVPRSDLPEASRATLAKEFAMIDGKLKVPTTKAMLFYTLRGFGFDPRDLGDKGLMRNHSLLPLEISNLSEIEKLLSRKPSSSNRSDDI